MPLYRTYREYLSERFPNHRQVRKVTLDGGFTCPNIDGTKGFGGCTYCDNRSFSPAMALRGESIRQQLDAQIPRTLARFPDAGILAYFQPFSNTHAPLEKLAELYEAALSHPAVIGLSIGTRPDCLEDEVLALLCQISRSHPLMLEIGLQTANDKSLVEMNRGHTRKEFEDCMQRCVQCIESERAQGFPGFDLGTHLIVGWPSETLEDVRHTAQCVAQFPFQAVKIHPLHIVRGTKLAQAWTRGEIPLIDFEKYCQAAAIIIRTLPQSTAIERFTGDAPGDSLLAPTWCGDRNAIVNRVEQLLRSTQSN